MKRAWLWDVLVWSAVGLTLLAFAGLLRAEPADAVVRIPSHGGSGTVIQAARGKSLILSAGHLFTDERTGRPDPALLARPLQIDAPSPSPGRGDRAGVRLVRVDYKADLCLIEVNRELPFVCPVAPPETHARNLLSAGYDQMCDFPGVRARVTCLGTRDGITWTREPPVPGRSGGALIDLDTGSVVGVCSAFSSAYPGGPPLHGIYIPLAKIRAFVYGESGGGMGDARGESSPHAGVPPPVFYQLPQRPPTGGCTPFG